MTCLVVGLTVGVFGPGGAHFHEEVQRVRELAGAEFARAWPRADDRRALAGNVARALGGAVTTTDAAGRALESTGAPCLAGEYTLRVENGGALLGFVHACVPHRSWSPYGMLVALFAGAAVLWGAAGVIARRLTRPLDQLVRVTQAIGAGDLGARVRLGRHQAGEVGALADSVNEMAARIERQLREERTLLAAVSHELRSPLARLRMLVELARGGASAERLDEIERELVGLDALIGKLLASSRLEFGELRLETLTASQVAARALEVAGLGAELLTDASNGALVEIDPTLVGRALGNLLENAAEHGRGVERLTVTRVQEGPRGERVRFEVTDRGPGFEPNVLEHAFEAFYSSRSSETVKESGSLGLGLALVARIARAHGGRAFAENRADGGGARAVLELPAAEVP
ncbi:MAG TPA: HAMP domain-containing sensor histidine kinase [Polyangiaceae bacterium]|nr:HAMP domain-containing sensor histidine kinase [Polyangiaceae bacterium]